MTQRRTVRATRAFFDDLDRQLPAERGPGGQPSRGDFQSQELLEIVEAFASGFDDLPPLVVGRLDYRVLVTKGRLVSAMAVVAQLARDGAVELVQLSLDLSGLDDTHVEDGDDDDREDDPDR